MDAQVFPDKLPCDEGGSFVVLLQNELPEEATDFCLIFEGLQTNRRRHGKAIKFDRRTLIGTVGRYGRAEEARVHVVGVSVAVKVDPFSMNFLNRYQLICDLLPSDVPLQVPVVLAKAFVGSGSAISDAEIDSEVTTIDEELADFCERDHPPIPADLTFRRFFGSQLDENLGSAGTLLHLAVELRLKQFAAQLLANSSELATARGDSNFVQLFADYKDLAVEQHVPLSDYAEIGKVMSSSSQQSKSNALASVLLEKKKTKMKRTRKLFRRLDLRKLGSKLKKRIKGTSSSKGMYMRRIIGRAIVKSDFIPSAQQEKFLKLKKGTEIFIVENFDGPWLKAVENRKEGRVMKSHIEILKTEEKSSYIEDDYNDWSNWVKVECENPYSSLCYRVQYHWKPRSDADLEVNAGDYVTILDQHESGWWNVRDDAGNEGTVPSNYLEQTESPLFSHADGLGKRVTAARGHQRQEKLQSPKSEKKAMMPEKRRSPPPLPRHQDYQESAIFSSSSIRGLSRPDWNSVQKELRKRSSRDGSLS
ncbi:uncharacterized protein [Oscarella lobularis]|uniref:uncharacterized protein isoform X2 n=1 Tax=Oscarella lobularis TaxID=121494 RepID=UPI003313508F